MSRLDDLDLTSGAKAGASVELPGAGLAEMDDSLARAEALPAAGSGDAMSPLVDLPLSASPPQTRLVPADARETAAPLPEPDGRAAPLPARAAAFAADAALVLLLAAVALLAGTAGRGQSLKIEGLAWTAVFAVYLSFFATAVPLILFGKTVGMSLTGLTARGDKGTPLTAAESSRRWLGTILTLAGLGIPLLVTRGNREAPSPGDRMSGRPLVLEEADRS